MLEALLRIVASKGTAASPELARRLNVSYALLESMLDELTRQGLLKVVAGGGSDSCRRCPLSSACLYRREGRIWALSRKGERWLDARRDKAM